MSNIESGFCTVEECTAFEEHRRQESEFQVDELYMMMFSLKSRKSHEQAAKKPSRITGIEQRDSGLYVVDMTILNDDLQPDCDTKALFRDGYWLRKGSRKLAVGGHAVKTAYMKSYYGEADSELDSMIEEGLPNPDMSTEILAPMSS